MLEDKVKFLSESMARTLDRRKFIKQAGTGIFMSLAYMAAGQKLIGQASASGVTPNVNQCNGYCSPPGLYCNTGGGDLSGCHGAHCFQNLYQGQILQCFLIYLWYPTGCWTWPGPNNGTCTCCDCGCGPDYQNPIVTCGCAQYSGARAPLPMVPGGK